jgi:hypothetical protein
MKTLKTKKVNVAICWNGLKNVPPKEFSNVGDMETTMTIIGLLKDEIPEFVEILEKTDKVGIEFQLNPSNPEIVERRASVIKEASKVELEKGEELVEIKFENADFNVFFNQFEKWGNNWFYKLEPYLDFRKDMNETNKQPKGK